MLPRIPCPRSPGATVQLEPRTALTGPTIPYGLGTRGSAAERGMAINDTSGSATLLGMSHANTDGLESTADMVIG
jgi:hypothetical protein